MDNPYQAPNSRIEAAVPASSELAGRGVRFGAAFIDGLILGAVIVGLEFATGFFQEMMEKAREGQTVSLGLLLVWSLIGLAAFAIIQGYPLLQNGQTWGKKACSIRIVNIDDQKPSPQQLLVRYSVYLLPGRVPFIGSLFSLVNVCFIFRDDRRCLHDLAAGTRVITA